MFGDIAYQINPIVVRVFGKPSFTICVHESIVQHVDMDVLVSTDPEVKTHYIRYGVSLAEPIVIDYEHFTSHVLYFKYEYKDGTMSQVYTEDLKAKLDLYKKLREPLANTDTSINTQLRNLIRHAMTEVEGSEVEQAHHNEKLFACNTDPKAREYVKSRIYGIVMESGLVAASEVESYAYDLYASMYGLGVLQKLDDDPKIGEIMVNAVEHPKFNCDIYYIQDGKKYKYHETFKNVDEIKQVFARAVDSENKQLNDIENAQMEATRTNNDRVQISMPKASVNYLMNIRKFSSFYPSVEHMKRVGTVTEDIDTLCDLIVRGKANIGIGGEMNTGKTTFINYLLTKTDPLDRKIVITGVDEMNPGNILEGHDLVILRVNETFNFTFRSQMNVALRLTGARVIVPESRDKEFTLVQDANVKIKGNMFTAHAQTADGFLDACVSMYCGDGMLDVSGAVLDKIAKHLDFIIIMTRIDGVIRIKSISEVVKDNKNKFSHTSKLLEWAFDRNNPTQGSYRFTGEKISEALKEKMNEAGVPGSILDRF